MSNLTAEMITDALLQSARLGSEVCVSERSRCTISFKPPESPSEPLVALASRIVTSADLAVQESILQCLLDCGLQNCAIRAEEDTPLTRRFGGNVDIATIFIDPIDGTLAYALGCPGWHATARRRCALVSVIGKDAGGKVVLDFCDGQKIDHDAFITPKGEFHTWRSIVIVHDSGQRLFLDVPSHAPVKQFTDRPQLNALLSSKALKAVYLDKSFVHPRNKGRFDKGFLSMSGPNGQTLKKLANRGVDVIYETGGHGTENAFVEKSLASVTNIMTAAFPFFWKWIRNANGRGPTRELKSIENLKKILRRRRADKQWVNIAKHWQSQANKFLRSGAGHRWLIVTLHGDGALAFDLTDPGPARMRWFRPKSVKRRIKIRNTAGAGDTFRGAFLYGLARVGAKKKDRNDLARCTSFAVRCATERCKKFEMEDFLTYLKGKGNRWWKSTRW